MIADQERIVREFFAAYERRMNDALADPSRTDLSGMRDAFADYFVGANPNGVRGGRNGLLFRLALSQGLKAYRRMGTRTMDIGRLDVTPLDPHHAMATVDWVATYDGRRGDGRDIAFTNIYLLQVRDGEARIFAWITPDEQAALKAHGLVD